MTAPRDAAANTDWVLLEGVLRVVEGLRPPQFAFEGDDGLGPEPDFQSMLDAARLLVLVGRADHASLMSLACRGAWYTWDLLLRRPAGTTAAVAAVLAGWEDTGDVPAGREAAVDTAAATWTGRHAYDIAQVFAVWHVVRAAAAGTDAGELRRLARAGALPPDDAWEAPDSHWW